MESSLPPDRTAVLTELRRRVAALERPGSAADVPGIALGAAAIDAALPWRGLPQGGLHEIAGPAEDDARLGFAALLLARCAGTGGSVLWCRRARAAAGGGAPYGPGLGAFGLQPAGLLLAVVPTATDLLWAMEEGLRCGRLAAVLGDGAAPDPTAARRLQLASETGHTPAFVLPPAGGAATAVALTRWRVASVPGEGAAVPGRIRWRLTLARCRGGAPADWIVEWDDAALSLRVVPALADRPPAATARSA